MKSSQQTSSRIFEVIAVLPIARNLDCRASSFAEEFRIGLGVIEKRREESEPCSAQSVAEESGQIRPAIKQWLRDSRACVVIWHDADSRRFCEQINAIVLTEMLFPFRHLPCLLGRACFGFVFEIIVRLDRSCVFDFRGGEAFWQFPRSQIHAEEFVDSVH